MSEKKSVVFPEAQAKFDKVKAQVCVFGNGVELKESTFGVGLFATKNFSKGEAITLYGGQLIDYKTARERCDNGRNSHIRRHIARQCCFDGRYKESDGSEILKPMEELVGLPVGAFCNDSSDASQINSRFNFIDSSYNEERYKDFEKGLPYSPLASERLTYIEALRDIIAGEEIQCSYGDQYWERAKEKKRASEPVGPTKKRKVFKVKHDPVVEKNVEETAKNEDV